MGNVYLLLSWDKDGNEVFKVGVSKNDPEKRVKQLQTGNDRTIELLKMYQSTHYKKIEKWLHRKYKSVKAAADNEWFYLSNEQVLDFLTECKKAEDNILFLLNNSTLY